MPSGLPFLPELATGLQVRLGDQLPRALILLPTRRAVRGLGDAFVALSAQDGQMASLLPRMRPLADINPDEPPFEPGDLAARVPPAIPAMQRQFELAKLLMAYQARLSDTPLDIAGALALAEPLIHILDDADMEEVSTHNLAALKDLRHKAAAHFQNAALFFDIIQTHWPRRLTEIGVLSPMARRVKLLNTLTDQWIDTPPDYPVIIAGSTGSLKATARLMRCVAHMPNGLIILPGLDRHLRYSSWDEIGAEHPQGALRRLIDIIGIDRVDIKNWAPEKAGSVKGYSGLPERRRLIGEALVPARDTDDWPSRIATMRKDFPGDVFAAALSGLSLIEAANDAEEAQSIALIMRETLEVPEKTAALVTPDPSLARRVRAALRRWDVNVDYSQGEPLEETPRGAFISGILALAGEPDNAVHRAFLCKHPMSTLGQPPGQLARDWRHLETAYRLPKRTITNWVDLDEDAIITRLTAAIAPLTGDRTLTVSGWARALTQACEAVAQSGDSRGADRLWQDDAGEKAASLLESLINFGDIFGEVSLADFTAVISKLMRTGAVRPRYGTHPRLQILGPLEARMLTADRIILGGLNEGIWPAAPTIEPFLSRGMRKAIGLSLPERRYGLAAHDFAELTANHTVILTRSHISGAGPMVASRWLWRLKTLVTGALGKEKAKTVLMPSKPYQTWAQQMDFVAPDQVKSVQQPAPKPDPRHRWPDGRKLSITQIKTWIRDPYSIYGRYVLGLRKMDDLKTLSGARDYGNAVHKGIETFTQRYKQSMPEAAPQILCDMITQALHDHGYPDYAIIREHSRLIHMARALISHMHTRRGAGWAIAGVEPFGTLGLSAKTGLPLDGPVFTLTGKADLVETGPHHYAIIDYKTGSPPSAAEVGAGFDPQLPLTALMIAKGAFQSIRPGDTQEMYYIRLSGHGEGAKITTLTPPGKNTRSAAEYITQTGEALIQLINRFDRSDTPYHSQPRVKFTHNYGDYDQLARRDEWARLGPDDGGDGQ